jgi:SPX domain protein involved in polyphosphate accumulation
MTVLEKSSPLLLERFELKFLIPSSLVQPIKDYISSFCVLDPYAEEDGKYTINTLYLDSPSFTLLKRRQNGEDNRFTLRIRSYGSGKKAPFFCEVKYKEGGVCKKFRSKLSQEQWEQSFGSDLAVPFSSENIIDDEYYNIFERLCLTYRAEPKILTQYRRNAYLSTMDDYARVTFDTSLKYTEETNFNLSPNSDYMNSYDSSIIFPDGCDVILELKCTTQVPLWMIDLIRKFNLQRTSFSKFSNSLSQIINEYYSFTPAISAHRVPINYL